ncbi:single-stranded DNA-binding protein [Phycicoccus flavus]|uniref:single-stranded DNA-binding protein n=1 Tax=Phycicoccus flavus TaxID=2502783 RepID=UPI000FEBB6C3|nr:single-stranded DNA-binding protein [Phycicoccus flavus]NHA68324.1 single-stranded DNA-binding protein [Phycicoccus flavus]
MGTDSRQDRDEDENSVRLVGRVTGVGQAVTLPSGDVVHTIRVTVTRPSSPGVARAGVDAIDVACWSGATRRAAGRLGAGDRVVVEGALRRRFFRAGGAPVSRYEVEAARLRRAPRRPGSGTSSGPAPAERR